MDNLCYILSPFLCFGRFLEVGKVVMEVVKSVPEVDMVVQSILRAGLQYMKTAGLALDTVEGNLFTEILSYYYTGSSSI